MAPPASPAPRNSLDSMLKLALVGGGAFAAYEFLWKPYKQRSDIEAEMVRQAHELAAAKGLSFNDALTEVAKVGCMAYATAKKVPSNVSGPACTILAEAAGKMREYAVKGAVKGAKVIGKGTKIAAKAVANAAEEVAEEAVDAAEAVGSGVSTGAKAVGSGTVTAIKAVGSGTATAVRTVGSGAKTLGKSSLFATRTILGTPKKVATTAAKTAASGAKSVGSAGKAVASTGKKAVVSVAKKLQFWGLEGLHG